ncbi:MAG: ParA family protein [Anaerolineales bacterium]|nr:ParA family protein [Anaerolineales bacterium]
MSKVYALTNQKGGVGKTTTTVNLGAYLALSGMRVLLIDIDPQSNTTSSLGFDKNDLSLSIYDAIINKTPVTEIILLTDHFCLELIPSSPALAGAEVEMVGLLAREHLLRKAIAPVVERYDYVLIDCPPSLGLLTINALTAATDGIIIPVQCEYLALEGLTMLTKTINLVRENLNLRLKIRGLLMTMYDTRTNLSREVVEEVRTHFAGKVFDTIIPRNIRLSEAPSHGETILSYAPQSVGGLTYRDLAHELIMGDA